MVDSTPPRTVYSLTERGVTVAKLGEPVFLFVGYAAGPNNPMVAIGKARF